MDNASLRAKILSDVNEYLRYNLDELPFDDEIGELLSSRYVMGMDKLRQLHQHILILQTIQKARL